MPPESSNQTTIIGPDTHIKGDMTFDSTARILGTFEGNITAKGELQIAEGATCKASVEAGKVVVDGLVEGNLTARERVELNAKARIKGDVVAARLVVADGASVSGRVTIGPDATKSSGRPAEDGKPNVVVTAHQQQGQGQGQPVRKP
ncbi:MAG: polymer-forming cytoskeletal protein [Phycisphaeraceae bacterium]|nr:polymer-forming cytoskeletal protein [Phycisphaeraceae bacterium]